MFTTNSQFSLRTLKSTKIVRRRILLNVSKRLLVSILFLQLLFFWNSCKDANRITNKEETGNKNALEFDYIIPVRRLQQPKKMACPVDSY